MPHDNYRFSGDTESPPNPGLTAIHSDAAGLLWTVMFVPDPRWQDASITGDDPYGRAIQKISNPSDRYDSLVEFIDPATATIIGSTTIDDVVCGFVEDGLLFAYGEYENQEPLLRIWRVRRPGHQPQG